VFKKTYQMSLFFILAVVLSGCQQQNPFENIYKVLEKAVAAEQTFAAQQEPIVVLEKEEKQIYERITAIGMKDKEQVAMLADKAAKMADQRKNHMDLETKSLLASEEEFQSLPSLIKEVKDPNLKEKAQELYQIMMERYDIHDEISKRYNEALQLDKELYAMLKGENVQFEQLEEQIGKINKAYELVLEVNKKFNEKTKEYNEKKLSLYKESGLDIKIEEE
jgi:hypothetical protein